LSAAARPTTSLSSAGVWATVNAWLNPLFDALFWPVQWLSPAWQVAVLAVPAAILALTIYKFFSNQAAIRDAKAKIVAYLFELRLFRDELRVQVSAQGRVFLNIGRYLAYSLIPMIVMLPPFLLMMIQIESRFAFRGLAPNEQALITVTVASDRPVSHVPVSLATDVGMQVVTPALRADPRGEIYWRVRAVTPGAHNLRLRVNSEEAQRLVKADAKTGVMTTAYRASDVRSLLYPRETALPSEGPIDAVAIDYPRARGEWAGLSSLSWLFFGLVMLYAFALRRVFKVSF
jgi:hypothetical protein